MQYSSIDAGVSTCDDIAGWQITNQLGPTFTHFEFDQLLAGTNCTIVLNATVQSDITPNETYTNTATITAYSSTPEGFGHDDNRLYPAIPDQPVSDTSTFTTAEPTITKSYLATSEDHTDSGDTRTGDSNANDVPRWPLAKSSATN